MKHRIEENYPYGIGQNARWSLVTTFDSGIEEVTFISEDEAEIQQAKERAEKAGLGAL